MHQLAISIGKYLLVSFIIVFYPHSFTSFFSMLILFRSPMTGKIVTVMVKPNDLVKIGDVLFIIESMKMETKIVSQRDGEVDEIFSEPQSLVEEGQKVVSLK